MPNVVRVPSLRLTELDGSPDIQGVERIYLTNGFLSNLGGGNALLSLSGSGGAAALTVRDIDGSPTVSSVNTIYLTNGFLSDLGGGAVLISLSGGGAGGAPTDATYITQTANGTLTNEQALSSLATGLMFVTTGTGVVTSVPLANAKVVRTAGDITTTSATFADATGMSITMTTGARRVMIAVVASSHCTASTNNMLDIDIDGARVGSTTYGTCLVTGQNTFNRNMSFTYITDVLSAGSHTFKLQLARESSGTMTLYASSSILPLVMSAVELPY